MFHWKASKVREIKAKLGYQVQYSKILIMFFGLNPLHCRSWVDDIWIDSEPVIWTNLINTNFLQPFVYLVIQQTLFLGCLWKHHIIEGLSLNIQRNGNLLVLTLLYTAIYIYLTLPWDLKVLDELSRSMGYYPTIMWSL